MDLETYKSNLESMNYSQIVSLLVNDVNHSCLTPHYRKAILDQLSTMNNKLIPREDSQKEKLVDEDLVEDIVSSIASDEYDEISETIVMKRLKKMDKLINKINRRGNVN